jgi:hypothetical protein
MRSEPVAFAVALLLAAAAGGCAHTPVADSAVDWQTLPSRELDFWQRLEQRPLATNHDALHAMFLLADGKDERVSYRTRLADARARGWVDAQADERTLPANDAATIGLVSVATCDLLEIAGGLTLRVLGRSPRYCTRELVYLGILPQRTPEQELRGLELVDLAGRIDDWREHHGEDKESATEGAP